MDSPSGRHLLDLPEDARVDDLVPGLVEVCEGRTDPAGWSLTPLGEAPLPGERTLGESGLYPGAVLVLTAPARPVLPEPALKAAVPAEAGPQIDRLNGKAYRRMLDGAITAPGLGGSMVVAVMSAHSGAGTTTVTALLATLLNTLRREQVVAVDACPQSGALSHWMAPENGALGAVYDSLLDPAATPDQVLAALVKLGPGLSILPAPSDQRSNREAGPADWGRLIEHLRHMHNFVIVDCGAGFQRAVSRAALASADVVVLVGRSNPGELDRLSPTIESIRARGRTVIVVANQSSQRARASRSGGVQEVSLAHEPQPATRLKTRGFSWSDAPDSWQEPMRELAAALVGTAQLKP